MGVSRHDAETLARAHVHSHAGRVAVSPVSIGENECLGTCPEGLREYRTVVGPAPSCESVRIEHTPVGDGNVVDLLVVDSLH